jgi:hypothetical protein
MRIVPNKHLSSSDLIIDAVYEGGASGNAADDPISKVLQGVGNQGGFRAAGRGQDRTLVVLYTSGEDQDWPDIVGYFSGSRRAARKSFSTWLLELVFASREVAKDKVRCCDRCEQRLISREGQLSSVEKVLGTSATGGLIP